MVKLVAVNKTSANNSLNSPESHPVGVILPAFSALLLLRLPAHSI
jgi:hypothetical protein